MKSTIVSVAVAIALVAGALALGGGNEASSGQSTVIDDGAGQVTQVVDILAKGAYSPQIISARAGIPTTIRMTTKSTFDCSSALAIPSVGYRQNLPPSGVTEISIPPQEAGKTIEGVCQMGMYGFTIRFE